MNETLNFILINILISIYAYINFTILLPEFPKLYYRFGLFVLIFLANYWGPDYFGQYITFIYIFIPALAIYIYSHKPYYSILTLCSYLFSILFNYLFTALLSAIFPVTAATFYETVTGLYMIILILFTTSGLYLIRRFLAAHNWLGFPDMPMGLQVLSLVELLFSLLLVATNFLVEHYLDYPSAFMQIIEVIILGFIISAAITFYNMQRISNENLMLKLAQQETEDMLSFIRQTEDNYSQMRQFRHDYHNIMAALKDYIDSGDLDTLKSYYYTTLSPFCNFSFENEKLITCLKYIDVRELKGILYSKALLASNNDIHLQLECNSAIASLAADPMIVSRLVGILLDNAIEAASETEEKFLSVAFICSSMSDSSEAPVTIVVENSTNKLSCNASQLLSRGFSTKRNHGGLGLPYVYETVAKSDALHFSFNYTDTRFTQTLTIAKEE